MPWSCLAGNFEFEPLAWRETFEKLRTQIIPKSRAQYLLLLLRERIQSTRPDDDDNDNDGMACDNGVVNRGHY
jgi:hypothetical protein